MSESSEITEIIVKLWLYKEVDLRVNSNNTVIFFTISSVFHLYTNVKKCSKRKIRIIFKNVQSRPNYAPTLTQEQPLKLVKLSTCILSDIALSQAKQKNVFATSSDQLFALSKLQTAVCSERYARTLYVSRALQAEENEVLRELHGSS